MNATKSPFNVLTRLVAAAVLALCVGTGSIQTSTGSGPAVPGVSSRAYNQQQAYNGSRGYNSNRSYNGSLAFNNSRNYNDGRTYNQGRAYNGGHPQSTSARTSLRDYNRA